jgi:uncharacterized protein YcfJ
MAAFRRTHSWAAVPLIVASIAVTMLAAPTAQPQVPKARAAAPIPNACTAMYWSASYRDDCASILARHHLSAQAQRCLILAVGTTFGAVVGGLIGGSAARAIVGAAVGGSASACINEITG